MPDYNFCVSLSVTHPTIDPAEISEKLGLSPAVERKVGDPRISRKGKLLGGDNKESFWRVNLHEEERLNSNEIYLEDFLSKKNEGLIIYKDYFKSLVDTGGYIEYFIGWFSVGSINMNITLEPKLLASTAELYISIGVAAYPNDD